MTEQKKNKKAILNQNGARAGDGGGGDGAGTAHSETVAHTFTSESKARMQEPLPQNEFASQEAPFFSEHLSAVHSEVVQSSLTVQDGAGERGGFFSPR